MENNETKMVNITINDVPLQVAEGTSILHAAKMMNVSVFMNCVVLCSLCAYYLYPNVSATAL
jgi:ferredoxin